MSQGTAEFVMAEIAALPVKERAKLAALMIGNELMGEAFLRLL